MKMSSMFNQQLLATFNDDDFLLNQPCPWTCFAGLLTDSAFQTLHDEFPALDLFEKHQAKARPDQRRPHHRYYLALEKSVYHNQAAGTRGCAQLSDLSPAWQQFIDQIRSDDVYLSFIQRLLGTSHLQIRFAWHVAGAGEDVSPHCDSKSKAGTQIFYFNTSADWQTAWGGGTVFLQGRKNDKLHPEVNDFETKITTSILDNRCLLFKNTAEAWHGVEPLRCPPDKYRRVFNVIFEQPAAERSRAKRGGILGRFKRHILARKS